ncbi:MAG: MFS transporter [Thermoplasmata archaeon]
MTSSGIIGLIKNRTVFAISAVELLRVMGRSGTWIFIPIYLILKRDVPFIDIGFLFLISSITSIPVSLFGGNLVDRIGRRKIAIALPPFISLIFLLMFLDIYYNLPLIIMYLSFISLFPLGGLQEVTDNVMITDTTIESERIDAFSIVRISANIGFSVGPALSGIALSYNFAILPMIPLIGEIIGFFLYFRIIRETKPISHNENRLISFPHKDRRFLIIAIVLALSWFSIGPWGYILSQFLSAVDKLSYSLIGIIFAVNGIAVISLQLPLNRALYKIDDMTRVSLGLIVYSATFFIFSLTRDVTLLIINVVALTIGENIISPASSSVIGKIAPEDKRGQYYGGFSLINNLIGPFSPLLYEFLLSLFLREPVILWGIISSICISLAFIIIFLRSWKRV